VKFYCFAPQASAVSLVGDFNCWRSWENPMQRQPEDSHEGILAGVGAASPLEFATRAHQHHLYDRAGLYGPLASLAGWHRG
jgi:1,4-alpha-glucan branching enzyme